jgi:hypothetical protein
MAFFINSSGTIASVLIAGTENLTGDIVSTLLMVFLFLLAVCFMFGIPLEFTAVIMLPMLIATAAYYSTFMGPLIVFLIYLATLLAKNWLIK